MPWVCGRAWMISQSFDTPLGKQRATWKNMLQEQVCLDILCFASLHRIEAKLVVAATFEIGLHSPWCITSQVRREHMWCNFPRGLETAITAAATTSTTTNYCSCWCYWLLLLVIIFVFSCAHLSSRNLLIKSSKSLRGRCLSSGKTSLKFNFALLCGRCIHGPNTATMRKLEPNAFMIVNTSVHVAAATALKYLHVVCM